MSRRCWSLANWNTGRLRKSNRLSMFPSCTKPKPRFCSPGASLNLYGKREARAGRKMGHLSACGENSEVALARVVDAYRRMAAGTVELVTACTGEHQGYDVQARARGTSSSPDVEASLDLQRGRFKLLLHSPDPVPPVALEAELGGIGGDPASAREPGESSAAFDRGSVRPVPRRR